MRPGTLDISRPKKEKEYGRAIINNLLCKRASKEVNSGGDAGDLSTHKCTRYPTHAYLQERRLSQVHWVPLDSLEDYRCCYRNTATNRAHLHSKPGTQTDRQTDAGTQTYRHPDTQTRRRRHTNTQAKRHTHTQRHTQTHRQTGRQAHREKERQRNRHVFYIFD